MGRITFLLALGATLLAANSDLAEKPKPKSEAGATVTVTAEATEVAVVKTPNPVVVIDKEAIEKSGAKTLSSLLQEAMPGQVLRSGGPGTSTSIFLGASRPQDTVITLDGFRLTDASGLGGVNTSLFGMTGVDRVEIQRGPSSTRFGSDALGGAIALYTAGSAPEGLSGELVESVGTHGNAGAQLGGAYGWSSGWLRTTLSAQRADAVTETKNPYRASNTFLGFGQQVGDEALLSLTYFNAYAGIPIPILFAGYGVGRRPDYSYNEKRESQSRMQVLGSSLRVNFAPDMRGEFSVGQVLQERLEPMSDGTPGRRYTSRRNQLNGNITWDLSSVNTFQVGMDTYEEVAWTPDAVNGDIRNKGEARHLALLLEGGVEPVDGFRIVASLRNQRDRQVIQPLGAPSQKTKITQTTGKLGLNWMASENWRFYVTAGTGFSNPLLNQTLWNAHYGGDKLRNEKSRFLQTGVSFQAGPWSSRLELSRTLYRSLVFYDPEGGTWIPDWYMLSGVYRNGSDVRIQSAEISGGYSVASWGLKGFYRNQEARDLKAPKEEQLETNAVIRRPFQSFGFSGYSVIGSVRLEGRWSWFGPRYEYGLPFGYKAHFNDVSLSALWTANDRLSFTLRGEHLLQPKTSKEDFLKRANDFDNDACQIFGFPAQPPTWTLEARYRF